MEDFSIALGLQLKDGEFEKIQKNISKLSEKPIELKINDSQIETKIKNIASQLSNLNGCNININVNGNVDTSGVTKQVSNLVNNVNREAQKVKSVEVQFIEPSARTGFKQQINNLIKDEQLLFETTRKYFGKFGEVTTKPFRNAANDINSFIVEVKNAAGQIESLKYNWFMDIDKQTGELLDSGYRYSGSSGSDNYAKVTAERTKQEQLLQQQIDKNNAAVTKYTATLESLKSKYKDVNASKAITDDTHQSTLDDQYNKAIASVNALGNATNRNFSSMQADANAEISKLKDLITKFQNAEYAANQLRAKPIEVVKQDEINLLREFEAKIKQSGVALSSFKSVDMSQLNSKANNITDKESLTEYLNLLSNAKSEFKALQQEQKVSQQAQKAQTQETNAAYQELLRTIKQINSIQVKLTGLDGNKDAQLISQLKGELSDLQAKALELRTTFNDSWNSEQLKRINEESQKVVNNLDRANAHMKDTTAANEQTAAYEKLLQVSKQIKDIRLKIANLSVGDNNQSQLSALNERLRQVTNQYNLLHQSLQGSMDSEQINKLNLQFSSLDFEISQINAKAEDLKRKLATDIKIKLDNGSLESQVSSVETKFEKLHIESQEIQHDFQTLRTYMSNMDGNDDIESVNEDYKKFETILTSVKNKVAELQRQQQIKLDNTRLDSQRTALSSQIDVWLKNNTAAASQFGETLQRIKSEIASADKVTLTKLKAEFQEVKRQAELAGKSGLTLVDSIESKLQSLGTYFSASMILAKGVQVVREMYDNVLSVDTAMTELYRVTDLTASQYETLYDKMTTSAKKYGTALDSIITSTASWVRLGFDADTSVRLAEITAMYQHVTDLDEGTAVKNLVTAYKGYQDELLEVTNGDSAAAMERISDIYDAIGNQLPVSAAQVAEGMTKWASVAEQAGASFEEASALVVGGGAVTQDFTAMGEALKISTLRIKGMKGALQELGEEVDDNIESVSKMQTQILNLTNGQVNIFEQDGKTFRNIYDIYSDIAKVYSSLDPTKAADLLETIAGKNRANQIQALITGWADVEKSVSVASNAEGTAAAENEKYLSSMQGRLETLEATWQALSNSFMDSDLLKGLVSTGTTLLNILDSIINQFGALPPIIATVAGALSIKNFGRNKMLFLKVNMPKVIIVLFGYGQFRYYGCCNTTV